MAAGGNLRSEAQFLCAICLDVFTDPVTTPCGHNFCKNCINEYWNHRVLSNCPLCKEDFRGRPTLKVNCFISEMVAQFRFEEQQKSSSHSSPGDILCDVCTGIKMKALKSCLVCLTSYCETHLEPHLLAPGMRRHQLVEPLGNLEDRMCTKHEKPLELFCKTDQMCICALCPLLGHKAHEFVPLNEEYNRKKAELKRTKSEIHSMIVRRHEKIEEINRSVKMSQDQADRELAEGVQVLADLKESLDKSLNQFIKEVEDKQTKMEKEADEVIAMLKNDVCELIGRSCEVDLLIVSEDQLRVLQTPKGAPPADDWTEFTICPPSYEGTVARVVARLEETLRKQVKTLMEAELTRVKRFALDVTLDPDTANPWLVLSDDGKQVYCGSVDKNLPENPKRFSRCSCVLGKQSFSLGRSYFEVQVKGKPAWDVGVARASVNRKSMVTLGPMNGYWTIWKRNEREYKALDDVAVSLSPVSPPEKVGVFVDYDDNLVSFYDVDAGILLYTFTGCHFTEELHPFFNPNLNNGGKNAAPLIICPVNQTA